MAASSRSCTRYDAPSLGHCDDGRKWDNWGGASYDGEGVHIHIYFRRDFHFWTREGGPCCCAGTASPL